jgi:tryptophan-rich sensory protein
MRVVKRLLAYCLGLCIVFCAASFAAVFVDAGSGWYAALKKPSFMPPSLGFSLFWGLEYLLFAGVIAIAFLKHRKDKIVFIYIGSVLLLNIIWTLVFFRLHLELTSLMLIVVHLILLIRLYRKMIHPAAVVALLVIIGWYLYLAVLNYAVALLI